MRKLKNLELVGKTRLIPGVGHVTFEEDVPEHVAVACEAAGLDWCETLTESPNAVSPLAPSGGIDGGDAGDASATLSNQTGDAGDASATLSNQTGDAGGPQVPQGDNGGEDGNVREDTN
ncbi:hypothetical protein, partial [Lacihabitans soyangensis]